MGSQEGTRCSCWAIAHGGCPSQTCATVHHLPGILLEPQVTMQSGLCACLSDRLCGSKHGITPLIDICIGREVAKVAVSHLVRLEDCDSKEYEKHNWQGCSTQIVPGEEHFHRLCRLDNHPLEVRAAGVACACPARCMRLQGT